MAAPVGNPGIATLSVPLQISNAAELEASLLGLLTPNNDHIMACTSLLKKFMKKVDCVMPMIQQVASSQHVQARQVGAVLLRRRIHFLWTKMTPAAQQQCKQILLDRLGKEPQRLVRHSVAALVAAVAKHTVPQNQWPELLQFLLQMSQTQSTAHREVAMMLFRALAETVGDSLKKHLKTLQAIFIKGLGDPQSGKVRLEALRALGVLVDYLDDNESIMHFRLAIPPLVAVVKDCLKNPEQTEEVAIVAFEVFEYLAQSEVPVMTQHMHIILPLMLDILCHRGLSVQFRDLAAQFVVTILENKPAKATKHGLVERLMATGFMLCVEPWTDVMEAGEMTPQKIGVDLLDAIILHLPRQLVFKDTVTNAMKLCGSQNPHDRKGGLVILAVMAEGCADELIELGLEKVLPYMYAGIKDPDRVVTAAACVALTQMGDHLQPEITEHHSQILPHLFLALQRGKGDVSITRKACVALEVFCEQLGKDVLPYLDSLMQKLSELFNTNNRKIQETAVMAISSVAVASGKDFQKYFQTCLGLMKTILLQKDDEVLRLRSKATECVGAMGLAVGAETFKPLMKEFIDLTIQGMSMGFFELRESAYNFFGHISTMLGEEFAVLLPTVLPLLFGTLASDDGVMTTSADDMFSPVGGAVADVNSSDSEDEVNDQEYVKMNFSIRSGALDEKVAALHCLAEIIEQTKKHYIPYLKKTMYFLGDISGYPHAYIRQSTMSCYGVIVRLMHICFPPSQPLLPGKPVPIAGQAQTVLGIVLKDVMSVLIDDIDKPVVSQALDNIRELAQLFGVAGIGPVMKQVVPVLQSVLDGKAPCQVRANEEEEEKLKDHDDIMDHATECISAFAEALGPAMDPVLRVFYPSLMKLMQPQRSPYDRSMAVGCFAEVGNAMKQVFAPYAKEVLAVALRGLSDKAIQVRRNSSFCVGVVCRWCPQIAAPFYGQCLQQLAPLFQTPKDTSAVSLTLMSEYEATRDNACSAVAKMLVSAAPNALPLQQTIALFLQGVPLKQDFEEAEHVYPCVAFLFSKYPQQMVPHLAKVVVVLVDAIGHPHVPQKFQVPLIQLAKFLLQQQAQTMHQLLSTVDPAKRERFLSLVQG